MTAENSVSHLEGRCSIHLSYGRGAKINQSAAFPSWAYYARLRCKGKFIRYTAGGAGEIAFSVV